MSIIVIGGAGFIGKNLIKALLLQNREVVCCDVVESFCLPGLKYYRVAEQSEYSDIINENDTVIYLKWNGVPVTGIEAEYISLRNNIGDLLNLLDICAKKKISKFIFSSSGGSVYGKPEYLPIDEKHRLMPISSYSIQKVSAEYYIMMLCKNIDFNILRIANPYGPGQRPFIGQGIISTYLASSLLDRQFQFRGDGASVRDYIYIDDLVSAIVNTIEYRGTERIFNIGSGVGYSLDQLISDIDNILIEKGLAPAKKEYIPAHPSDVNANILDCTLAENELEWKCKYDLKAGIDAMLDSWNNSTEIFEVFR